MMAVSHISANAASSTTSAPELQSTQIRNVDVQFPFQPYECQVTFMERVLECLQQRENGVLESPTGTGKTLSLLCASLAWKLQVKAKMQLDQNMVKLEGEGGQIESNLRSSALGGVGDWGSSPSSGFFGSGPQIIYASRTHAQLSQAMAELKRSPYGHLFKAVILGSREQFCIHTEVQNVDNHSAKVHLCRAKVKANICPFYNKLQNKDLNDIDERLTAVNHDIEDLVQLGKKNKVCPYYVSRSLRGPADIIFTPYNYLLDPKARKSYGIELTSNVVIFDEAHNLEQFCEETSSFSISSYDISTALEAIDELSNKLQNQDGNTMNDSFGAGAFGTLDAGEKGLEGPSFTVEDLQAIRVVFKAFENQIDGLNLGSKKALSKPGLFMLDLLRDSQITMETAGNFTTVLDNVLQELNQSKSGAASPWSTKTFGLEKFLDLINCVFTKAEGGHSNQSQIHWSIYYRVYVAEEETWQSKKQKKAADPWAAAAKTQRVLNYWCFSPGHCMREVMSQGVHSLILTSGTLAPLSSFASEMQLPFKVTLENPHIIQGNQFWVGTIPKGPDGTSLCSSYANRFNETYQLSLGNTLVNLARITPDGMLVFFPSYGVMAQLTAKWDEAGITNRISQYKPVFKEPKTKTEFQSVMSEYYANIDNPQGNGAIFMAVCRGKVSEGLDFADMNGRAVVITGLPYPPRMDPRVILKMDFLTSMQNKLDIKGLGGEEWYKQQAFRAVNQAIGRVIRHKSDWGAIILCDERFGSSNVSAQLPSWVRPYATSHKNFGIGLKSLVSFYKDAKVSLPQPSKVNKNVKAKDENCNTEFGSCGRGGGGGVGGGGSSSSCDGGVDAFSYQKRSASSMSSVKSNSVDYHVPSLDARRRFAGTEEDLRSNIATPPSQQPKKRPLKIEYDDDFGRRKDVKKPSFSSVFDALESGSKTKTMKTNGGIVEEEEQSAAEMALERRMATQQAKKKIKVASGGGGGLRVSLMNQVLKKAVGVAKPLKTSTPKRTETSPDGESKLKELSSIHDSLNIKSEKTAEDASIAANGVSPKSQFSKAPSNQNGIVKREPFANGIRPTLSSNAATSTTSTTSSSAPATTASSKAPSLQSREKAASYLASVKKNLKDSVDLYQRFTAALKKYQKENEYEELTQVLVQVFLSREQWYPLLRGFYHFLRNNHKAKFNELCVSLTGQGCET